MNLQKSSPAAVPYLRLVVSNPPPPQPDPAALRAQAIDAWDQDLAAEHAAFRALAGRS